MSLEIFDNSLIKLLVRQGTDNERKNVILNPGEPGYTTDTRRFFVGDGATRGGVLAGNLFKGSGPSITLFAPAEIGDLAYSTTDRTLYRLRENDGSRFADWEEIAKTTTTSGSGLSGDYVLKSGDTITANTSRAGLLIKQLGDGNALEVEDPNSTATRFAITNQGHVGIGTEAPTAGLHVVSLSSTNLARFVGSGDRFRGIEIQNNFANASRESSVFTTVHNEFDHAVSNIETIIRTDGASEMVFQTQNAGTRTDRRIERLRIDEVGNVGVGVSNPTAKLDVNGIIKGTTLQGNLSGQTINLTGGITGSASFDGTSELNINTTITGNSIAWVVFNGVGTVSIINSYNVSSIADLGRGRYVVNFSPALPTADYCYVATARQQNSVNDGNTVSPRANAPKTITSLEITTTEGGNPEDSPEVCVVIFA